MIIIRRIITPKSCSLRNFYLQMRKMSMKLAFTVINYNLLQMLQHNNLLKYYIQSLVSAIIIRVT